MRVLPLYGETCTAVFCMQRGVVKHDAPQGVGKTPSPLPLRPPVAGLVPFLAGQLVGGLAEPFNGFQFFQIPGRRVIRLWRCSNSSRFSGFTLASCLWTALYLLYCAHISPRSVSVAIRRSALTISPRRS